MFPVVKWLPIYSRADFLSDLVVGLTVGVMLILWGGYDRFTTVKAAPELKDEVEEEEDEEE